MPGVGVGVAAGAQAESSSTRTTNKAAAKYFFSTCISFRVTWIRSFSGKGGRGPRLESEAGSLAAPRQYEASERLASMPELPRSVTPKLGLFSKKHATIVGERLRQPDGWRWLRARISTYPKDGQAGVPCPFC